MSVYNLGSNRMLCWDDFAIDRHENIEIKMHRPTPRDYAVIGNAEWDGIHNGYGSVAKVGDKCYFWHRASTDYYDADSNIRRVFQNQNTVFEVLESYDGKKFKKKFVNKHLFNGKIENNIFLDERRDNFAVCYDENPNCDPAEKFKAFSMGGGEGYPQDGGPHGLYMFVSPDGINFTPKGRLDLPGSFDSFNIAFWDKDINKYRLYYRSERRRSGEEFDVVHKSANTIREIHTATTSDFKTFEVFGALNYGENKDIMQLYTNNTVKYPRAENMYIAFPGRYNERWNSRDNLSTMPLGDRRVKMQDRNDRTATGITDTVFMFSRDGYNFTRFDEYFIKPYSEYRWWYGDSYMARGLIETESDVENAPNEYSIYSIENYRTNKVCWRRHTVRLDGFVSWNAKYSGGEVLTKPFTFTGNELELNFETGAMGTLIVTVCDENGNELEGYKTCEMFGDTVGRPAIFEKDLKQLNGKPIRLKFYLKDCDLYSYKFN